MRTLRFISLLALAVLLAVAPGASALAAEYGSVDSVSQTDVRITVIGGELVKSDPGEIVTVVYRIESETAYSNLTPTFEIPSDWGIVFGRDVVEIVENEPTTRFVTYRVPASALAGDFELAFGLQDENGASIATVSSTVRVAKILDFAFDSDPIDPFVSAGQALETALVLSNEGNAPITIALAFDEPQYMSIDVDQRKVDLPAGDIVSIPVRFHTDASIERSERVSIRFDATAPDAPELTKYQTISFDVVPVYSRIKPKAATIPVSLAIETVGDEKGATPQMAIAGSMPIKGGQLSIVANLSETPRRKMYGTDRQFTATYERKGVTVKVGDHSERISPLTLTGERGVGASAKVQQGDWTFKGSAQQSRYALPPQKRAAISAERVISETSRVSANLLHRNDFYSGTLFSVRSVSQPFGQQSVLDVECGVSNTDLLRDPTCALMATNGTQLMSWRLVADRASESFPGSRAGLTQLSEYVSFRVSKSFRLDNNIRWMRRIDRQGYGRSSLFAKVGMNYSQRLPGGSFHATVHGIRTESAYSGMQSTTHRDENIIRATSGYQLRRMGISLSIEEGYSTSDDSDVRSHLRRIKSNMRWSPTSTFNINGSVERSTGSLSAVSMDQKQRQIGLSFNKLFPRGFNATVSGYHNAMTSVSRQEYASIRTGIGKSFKSGRKLDLRMQFNQSTGRQTIQSTDYRFSFRTPIHVPYNEARSAHEVLRGRLVDHVTGNPIEGVLLYLGGEMAISDSEGRFVFPRGGEDMLFLRIDQGSLGYDRTPLMQLPMQISPEEYVGTELLLPVAKAASISGSVDIFRFSGSEDTLLGQDNADLIRDRGLFGAIVEIRSGDLRLRARSNRDGSFSFQNLPPGGYDVEVVRINLDTRQEMKESLLKVILEEGGAEELQFRVEPVRKRVRVIQTTDLSMGDTVRDASSEVSTKPEADERTNVPAVNNAQRPESSSLNINKSSSAPSSSEQSGSIRTAPKQTRTETDEKPISSAASSSTQEANDWSNALIETARSTTDDDSEASTSMIPYWLETSRSPAPRSLGSIYALLFVLSILFMLVAIDNIVRHMFVDGARPIRSLRTPSWLVLTRQLVLYSTLIVLTGISQGLLASLAVALAVSGICVAVETKLTYKAMWAICMMRLKVGPLIGTWVRHRDSAARITYLGLERIEVEYLDGSTSEFPTHRFNALCGESWTGRAGLLIESRTRIDRWANLRSLRIAATEHLSPLALNHLAGCFHVSFVDLDEATTIMEVRILIDSAAAGSTDINATVERSIVECGYSVQKATQEASSETKKEYPPLRLVKGNKAA